MELLLGVITGIIFGFLLQKGQVLRFEKQVGFLRLQDFTIIKFMFSAILVGMIGIYLLNSLGMIELKIKDLKIGSQVIGGLLFGAGWAILGYCPGTAVGAVAEGRWHAIWGIVGMLAGAMIYAHIYPQVKSTIDTWGVYGKVTIPGLLGINPWIVVAVFAAIILGILCMLRKK